MTPESSESASLPILALRSLLSKSKSCMAMDKAGATIKPASEGSSVNGTRPEVEMGPTASVWTGDADLEGQKKRHLAKKAGLLATIGLAYRATGVVYGDIGTSPLYVYSSTFSDGTPSTDRILGCASLIFWTLTLAVLIKYMCFVMFADDNGEGGTFALYSLLCRNANITPGGGAAPVAADLQLSRYTSKHSSRQFLTRKTPARVLKNMLERKAWARNALLILVLVMTSMVLGDGVLTPAQSVLGAVYGIQVKLPSTSTSVIVGVSCAIVVALFAAQPFGTGRVGFMFAPVVIIWFASNVVIAIYNTATYYPGIYKCLSPHYAYFFFKDDAHRGWRQLAGVFLAITGAEATFADLGHFSRAGVQLGFVGLAYPSLVITYFGQAAWLIKHPDEVGSTFYASIPGGDGLFWYMFVVATLAATVASQAMISGAFSIVKQSMALGCFPRLRVFNTSDRVTGQVYIPEVNWVMMILTVIVIVIFKNTTKLGLAYGVAVSAMMVGTDLLIFIVMLMVWESNVVAAVAFLLFYAFFDGTYLSANLEKVPDGGWYAILVAGVVSALSLIWYWGTSKKLTYLFANKTRLEDLVTVHRPPPSSDAPSERALAPRDGTLANARTGLPILRAPGIALTYSETLVGAPPLMPSLIDRWSCLHQHVVLVTVRQVAVPRVDPEERILVQKLPYPGMYRAVARYGYLDRVNHGSAFVLKLTDRLSTLDPDIKRAAADADAAAGAGVGTVLYIFSRQKLTSHKGEDDNVVLRWVRRFMLETVYGTMVKFAHVSHEEWGIPHANKFEGGASAGQWSESRRFVCALIPTGDSGGPGRLCIRSSR
ncbi:Potassium transporter family protein [Klebsormidium nitens]|uniref:Potassium transporter n=1 Tax=Klebsormidium nitens TaxID=105231 RepID=A0A0U9HKF5_KLENI|nr:Potassium transporter family protein [Klebsormidium nitens]|eukprot:GAQ87155.1 Potassium transporter family protein [Klebsormidium nitens]